MAEDISQEVTELIANVIGKNASELKPDTNFWNDLGIDSIKAIEITVAIERRFKVRIRDEQIPKISTVGEAAEVVKQALEKKPK